MTQSHLPSVSVVMPAYNSSRYIADSVQSALDQSYDNLEVVVVDDGSTDDTLEIAKSFGSRVRVHQQANAGSASARNRGAEIADGEWLAFLDSDDLWAPDKIKKQLAHCEDKVWSHTDWFYAGSGQDASVKGSDRAPKFGGSILPKLIVNNFVATSTVLLKRDVFMEVGGMDISLRALQDWDLWLRIAARYDLDYLPEPLVSYRIHESSTSRSPRKTKPFHMEMIDRIYAPGGVGESMPHLRRRTLAESYGVLSLIAEESGDFRFALSCAMRSAFHTPGVPYRWKSVIRIALGLIGPRPVT